MRRGEQYLVAASGRILAKIIDGSAFAAPDRAFALDFGDDDVDMRLGAAADDEFAGDRPAFDTRAFQLDRSEEHTSELQSLMRISYAAFFLKKKQHEYLSVLCSTITAPSSTSSYHLQVSVFTLT